MPHPVTIPRLGWSMEEGVFTAWLKAPGDAVCVGDMLFVLEGEKAAEEIESFDSGLLWVPADAPQPGATVKVGDVIGFLLAEGETGPASVGVQPTAPTAAATAKQLPAAPLPGPPPPTASAHPPRLLPGQARATGPAARRLARQLGIDLNIVATPDPTGRVLSEDLQRGASPRGQSRSTFGIPQRTAATPRARRRARELGIDLAELTGTGRHGRIRERDVEAVAVARHRPLRHTTAAIPPTEPGRFVPASKLRTAIAERMSAGLHQAVPVTLTSKVDAGALVRFRERLKATSQGGIVPTYNDILIFHAAHTLRELPELNACWHRDGIHWYDAIHVATAVDTPDGLLAPVVRHADRSTLADIAADTRQLVNLARSGKLAQKQLSGGTFTLSNLGMFGIDAFTPILNLPQAAILGVGRIVTEPVIRDNAIVVGQSLTLSLTFDHRVVDGGPAARWLQRLSERLQSPEAEPEPEPSPAS